MLNTKIKGFGGVKNQYIIFKNNDVYFQSYNSIIALRKNNKIYLDKNDFDYSKTTVKYLCKFLGIEWSLKNVQNGIASGEYILTDLND